MIYNIFHNKHYCAAFNLSALLCKCNVFVLLTLLFVNFVLSYMLVKIIIEKKKNQLCLNTNKKYILLICCALLVNVLGTINSEYKFFIEKVSLMIRIGIRKHYFIDSKVAKNMMLSNEGKLLNQGVHISGLDKYERTVHPRILV